MTPSYRLPYETNGGFSASIEGSALKIHSSSGAQGIGRVNVTVDDGETTFTQRFSVIVTGDATAITQHPRKVSKLSRYAVCATSTLNKSVRPD